MLTAIVAAFVLGYYVGGLPGYMARLLALHDAGYTWLAAARMAMDPVDGAWR